MIYGLSKKVSDNSWWPEIHGLLYTALFSCVGTLHGYEICCDDSVRLALQYKTAKLHVHSLMRSTKLNKMCIIFTICG